MRYIVGYTDTPAGRDALALGIRIARTTGARLDIVLVLANEERPTITPALLLHREMHWGSARSSA